MSAEDLIEAVQGDIQEVLRLLDVEKVDVNSTGGYFGSVLSAAIWGGNMEVVPILLDRGADVNSTGGDYGSALGVAVYRRGKEVISLLLNRGANINIVGGKYGTALIAAAYHGYSDIVSLLIARGADVNAASSIGQYGTALAVAALRGNRTIVSLLLACGANTNIVCGYYGTALAAASYHGHRDIVSNLLGYPGTDINVIGGEHGTALGAAWAGTPPTYRDRGTRIYVPPNIKLLLDYGADINAVGCSYGSLLGKAAYDGNKKRVSLLLAFRADAFHVGGQYGTVTGEYPTAMDAARAGYGAGDGAGDASEDIVTLLSKAMDNPVKERDPMPWPVKEIDTTPWPPFPMPCMNFPTAMQVSSQTPLHSTISSCYDSLEAIVNDISQTRTWNGNLTPAQADLPCKAVGEERLRRLLVALVGIHKEIAERLEVWIQNDVHYLINQGYDLGLAYAAARVAWMQFNDSDFNVAVHRGQWLAKATQLDEVRERAIYMDDTGQELIKSPYRIMPRRIWDLKSNRVVEFQMLHSDFLAREYQSGGIIDVEKAPPPPFWAITHSWTNEMSPVTTSINQYQWPTPLPRDLDLEHGVRRELLNKGAEYVWLDVLCLRQDSTANDTKHDEWRLDVPTIGNIYRAAVGIARYFNGLGQPFSTTGWDDPRHWLCRAWTLQEIRSENTTYNAGISTNTSGLAHIIMNTKGRVGRKVTTLRQALHPIVKLAAQADSLSGCSVYELVQQMAKRHATQPTDKVAGLFYLLRTTQLPTYDAGISDRNVWGRCFHMLPFERKIEILFDFPYGADRANDGHDCYWFPTWSQLMEWPGRDPNYDHTIADWNQAHLQIVQAEKPEHLFVSDIWAISGVHLHQRNESNEYEIDFDIGNEIFPFYYPYMHQTLIELSTSGTYTLVTTYPDNSYNWVVCESLGERYEKCMMPDGVVKMAEVVPLRKLGVLRTDSSSEFFLGRGSRDSILKKINALFV